MTCWAAGSGFYLGLGVALATAVPAGARAADTRAEILSADHAFAQESVRHGAPAAFAAFLDPEQGRIFDGGAPVVGHAAVAAALPALVPPGTVLWWKPLEAWGEGGVGGTLGDWALVQRGTKKIIVAGRYADIWHRDAQGRWRVLVDLGTPDTKPAPNRAVDTAGKAVR